MEQELRQALRLAAADPQACAATLRLYQDVQAEIDMRRPRCVMSGRCCQFEEFGHRLYVTSLELGAFMRDLGRREGEAPAEPSISGISRLGGSLALPALALPAIAAWDGRGCPFQAGKLCGVHAIRPFGCRIFFCDPDAREWQEKLYERFHAGLKRLHEQFSIPYFYVEWRQALRICGVGAASAAADPDNGG